MTKILNQKCKTYIEPPVVSKSHVVCVTILKYKIMIDNQNKYKNFISDFLN